MDPEAKRRDEIVRQNLVAYLDKRICGSDTWTTGRWDELVGELRATPGLARFLRRTKDHKLRIDKAALARDARFDGKWLIRTSDDTLSPTDLATAYKQLSQVERGWRDLKGSLRLRPVYHHREDRIAERSATTKRQREILSALALREPAQILDYELPPPVEIRVARPRIPTDRLQEASTGRELRPATAQSLSASSVQTAASVVSGWCPTWNPKSTDCSGSVPAGTAAEQTQ